MLKTLAIAAAAAIVVSAGFAAGSASAQIVRPNGGGGGMHVGGRGFGGGGGAMRFGSHGFGGGGMRFGRAFGGSGRFAPRGFAFGGFGHYGFGRYGLGHAFAPIAGRYVNAGRFGAAAGAFGAAQAFHHRWSGWQGYRRGYVGWGGPVFWPYAYDDVFDYAFCALRPGRRSLLVVRLRRSVRRHPAALRQCGARRRLRIRLGSPRVVSAPPAQANAQPQASGGAPASAGQLCVSAAIARRRRGDRPDRQGRPADRRPERQARSAEERRDRRRKDARRLLLAADADDHGRPARRRAGPAAGDDPGGQHRRWSPRRLLCVAERRAEGAIQRARRGARMARRRIWRSCAGRTTPCPPSPSIGSPPPSSRTTSSGRR